MKPLRPLELIVLNAYWIGLSFMWNSLHVIILPAVLLLLVPENLKNTYLGLLTFLGLIVAMLIQPISGALSDRWKSPWGRRRPLGLLGTSFDFLFLAVLGWAGGLGWLALGYIGLQVSSNIAHGPMQGLLPDQAPPEQLGRASAFRSLMDMLGLIISSLLMGQIFSPGTRHPWMAMAVVMAVLAAGAAVTFIGVHERRTDQVSPGGEMPGKTTPAASADPSLRKILQIDWRSHRPFAWLIGSRLAFLTGIYGIQVFSQYYLRDVLKAENPVALTGNLLAAITVALVIFALTGGWLGDHFGHRVMSYAASGIGAAGCLLLLWARTPGTVLAFGGVLGVGIGLFLTANWALLNRMAPPAQTGLFMGLTNMATAGAGAIGRLEGPGIDLLNNARPGAWWGYSGLFMLGMVCMLLSAALLAKVEKPVYQ